jgi:hypothetical protein
MIRLPFLKLLTLIYANGKIITKVVNLLPMIIKNNIFIVKIKKGAHIW